MGEGTGTGTPSATINYITLTEEGLKELVKDAVAEAISLHQCFLSEEERSIVRDIVTGGKYVKRSILAALAGTILYLIVKGIATVKGITF